MSLKDRLQRLLPNGYPRYVRVYDNGGETADRYTVVFTGRYNNRVERSRREYVHFGMSEDPFHGIGQMGFSKEIIDLKDGRWAPVYGKSNHLGKRIHWHEMPDACQKAALHVYKELWELYAGDTKTAEGKTSAGRNAGGVRIIKAKASDRRPD